MHSITTVFLLTIGLTLTAAQGWGGGWNGGGWGGGAPRPMGGWGGHGGMGGWRGGGSGGWPNGQNGGWNTGGSNVGDGNILNKDNFQASGCGWDFNLKQCRDLSVLPPGCQGGCRNFANNIFSDCRCVPYNFFGKK
uniref:Uncharacterized protein n=1 Tax=Plectus sambesii TaxID=2011161 RepID=A0A914WGZ9_9BILA